VTAIPSDLKCGSRRLKQPAKRETSGQAIRACHGLVPRRCL